MLPNMQDTTLLSLNLLVLHFGCFVLGMCASPGRSSALPCGETGLGDRQTQVHSSASPYKPCDPRQFHIP